MGLDALELVLRIEASFDLKISDAEAGNLKTVGDLADLVWQKVRQRERPFFETSRVFYDLRSFFVYWLGLARHQIRPNQALDGLIPREHRQAVWHELEKQGYSMPYLGLSQACFWSAVCLVLAISLGLGIQEPIPLLGCLTLVFPLGKIAYWLTHPLAVHYYCGSGTLRDLVIHLAQSRETDPNYGFWTRNEIFLKVRLLISEFNGSPVETIKQDTSLANILD